MSSPKLPGGVVHKLPGDLRVALIANPTALDAWIDITPLARNEFICWVEDAKQRRPGSAASAGLRKSWKKASADRAAGRDAHTACATVGSGDSAPQPARTTGAPRSIPPTVVGLALVEIMKRGDSADREAPELNDVAVRIKHVVPHQTLEAKCSIGDEPARCSDGIECTLERETSNTGLIDALSRGSGGRVISMFADIEWTKTSSRSFTIRMSPEDSCNASASSTAA